MEVIEESKLIKEKADLLLENWKLLDFLRGYGEAYSVGSQALDLMTWRDIDLEVICSNSPTKDNAIDVARYLFNIDGVRKVTPIDYSDGDGIKKPKGLYVGAEYVDSDEKKWKLDVWLLTPESARTKEKTAELSRRLTPEFRETILQIKSQVHNHPLYRKSFTSVDIYDAVLDEGAKDLDGLLNCLKAKGINIEL